MTASPVVNSQLQDRNAMATLMYEHVCFLLAIKILQIYISGKGRDFKIMKEVAGSQNIFLFNVVEDPYEQSEISAENKDIVIKLLNKLKVYNATALPGIIFEKDFDGANPKNHGGAWMPWRDLNVSQQKDEL